MKSRRYNFMSGEKPYEKLQIKLTKARENFLVENGASSVKLRISVEKERKKT